MMILLNALILNITQGEKVCSVDIIVTICTCGIGSIWGFIEGIMILAGVMNKDAEGRPLVE
jgi:hypothetical protein